MWEMAKQVGYTPVTDLWEQFTKIESNGKTAINDLAEASFEQYKNNIIYLTELVMVINHKCWYWSEQNNNYIARFYSDLYYEYDKRAINYIEANLTPSALSYYFRTLD